MKISILRKPVDGFMNIKVSLHEFTNNLGKNVDVSIWVPYDDSRSVLEKRARDAAITQLKLAISALESENHE